ncbi:winged helix DNA-binding domain-containing protein [Streptomyces sp. NBC_01803]|uniref:winged helix DNA-binding domain-containing protein n=1 Tax=Streptomyces sp. NBC_01803 TaxID=2975946 RepID=UPI002DDAF83D|nr:winged helix DNA-binding domain-containing protein [Streptomyces sp. NBC_01803]WSA43744.1 winged helix DNA-binding domain-containing protein [Streptomyces sp. NBC_01803]
MTTIRPLSLRELNRALLDRQFLLRRPALDAAAAVEHLVGLQTQVPSNHYTALWSRLDGFDPDDFSRRFEAREFVRISLQRSTIHTVTARDCLALRPVLRPGHERPFRSAWAKRLTGVDLDRVAARARELVEERPRTFQELGRELGAEWPDADRPALAQVARHALALVQVPPRGLWRRGGAARHTTAESWLGGRQAADTAPDGLVLRYLAAFGPASVKDAQMWSGLTRLREVFDRLLPRLERFRDANGVELYDLPDAPRPGEDVPAPARFLPEYDNLFIGHADRSRVISAAAKSRSWVGNRALPVFLADGFVRGLWRVDADRGHTAATLVLTPFDRLTAAERTDLAEEGARLLAFLPQAAGGPGGAPIPGTVHDVRWE